MALALPPVAASGQQLDTALLWSLLPGGGHFYLGDPAAGATYAGLTLALAGLGAEVDRRNDAAGRDDEVNVPWLAAQKVWEYSIYTTLRGALAAEGVDLRARRFDDTPTARLLAAPFDPGQFLRPAVFGAALLGASLAAIAADRRDARVGRLDDVARAHLLGDTFGRDEATALYAVSAGAVSLGAGVAEEGLFRGTLQPMWQERWGPGPGRFAAAGLFGLAHIVGIDGEINGEGVVFATAAGAYLGWLYDRDGARLAGPIAAHFWYDFALLGTSWVLDPDETPLGFEVEFSF